MHVGRLQQRMDEEEWHGGADGEGRRGEHRREKEGREGRGKKVGEWEDALLALSRLPISLVKSTGGQRGTRPGRAGGGCGVRAFPSG